MGNGKRTAYAVIGAGYGDEGKGLMTDFLASRGADVVVRTNGGAQAGHTVETPEGVRHVFHHFASGSLAGVPTHLSRFFVSNPMLFFGERAALEGKGGRVDVSADPRGIVTTPWDMMLNQFIEVRRGGGRHGSCGVGFGEAIERSLRPEYLLTVGDLHSGIALVDRLSAIRMEWVGPRLVELGGGALTDTEHRIVFDDGILERFVEECAAYADAVDLLPDSGLRGTIVFEGAQGLLLDQDYGAFPHVTRSNTGVRNMAEVAKEANVGRIEAMYMTRAYVTRHGAGPMDHEEEGTPFARIVDPTNVHNEWQGTIRAAPLDASVLAAAVRHDVGQGDGSVEVVASLAVTCLDQIDGEAVLHSDEGRLAVEPGRMAEEVSRLTGFAVGMESWGATREGLRATNESLTKASFL